MLNEKENFRSVQFARQESRHVVVKMFLRKFVRSFSTSVICVDAYHYFAGSSLLTVLRHPRCTEQKVEGIDLEGSAVGFSFILCHLPVAVFVMFPTRRMISCHKRYELGLLHLVEKLGYNCTSCLGREETLVFVDNKQLLHAF